MQGSGAAPGPAGKQTFMITQLPLAVQLSPEISLADFIPGGNAQLLDQLNQLAHGESRSNLFLSGPQASGKSHLLMGLCAQAQTLNCAYLPLGEVKDHSPDILQGLDQVDLLALDDIHQIAGRKDWEEALFVLFNQRQAMERPMVFSALQGPAQLPLELSDLRSRLCWAGSYRILPLDDDGLAELLRQQAGKRGLVMDEVAIRWLLSRHQRNARQLLNILDTLDRAALAAKKPRLTLPFVQAQLH